MHDEPPADILGHLAERGLIARDAPCLRMTGGRTNRVWHIADGGCGKVLKLYETGGANPLFPNIQQAEVAALEQLSGTGLAPVLRAFGGAPEGPWIVYDRFDGATWDKDAYLVAAMLGRVHTMSAGKITRSGANGSDDLRQQILTILHQCTGPLVDELTALIPATHIPQTHTPCLVHGDPVSANILVREGQAILIDWQCPAVGDPCDDLALFLSPAMHWVYRGAPLDDAEVNQFLAHYPNPDVTARYRRLRRFYALRHAAYCLWQCQRGAEVYRHGLTLERAALGDHSSAW